ncbi:hypothetical protein C8T65DRAFT_640172 [Cerioporus squamosus]|nr:hypothetical protein C8T65DRAFT_640172 [Cerioporus squamosus]
MHPRPAPTFSESLRTQNAEIAMPGHYSSAGPFRMFLPPPTVPNLHMAWLYTIEIC